DRDRPAVGAVVIDDRRHAVVGRDGQKLRLELVALGDVDRDHGVREGALLEHDRDLPTIGRRPVIEVDGFLLARMPCRLERCGGAAGLAHAGVLLAGLFGATGPGPAPSTTGRRLSALRPTATNPGLPCPA